MATRPIVALFESDSDARAAVRRLLGQGISRYSVSLLEPDALRKPPRSRKGASFFTGLLFGGLLGGGLSIAARLYPQVAQFFEADWMTAAIVGAVLGALGGGFIGYAVASAFGNDRPDLMKDTVTEGEWPSGALVAVQADSEETAKWQQALRELGAVNLVDTHASADARTTPPASAEPVLNRVAEGTVEYVPPTRAAARPAPVQPPAEKQVTRTSDIDFLGRELGASAPARTESEPQTAGESPASERRAFGRRATDRVMERRSATGDRRQSVR
jgi:hypothetical protein